MKTISAKTRKKEEEPKVLREKGEVPSVLYGPKTDPISLKINQKEFNKLYREVGETSLVKLNFEDEERKVLIHDLQKHPVSGKVIHIDFYQPSLTEKTTAQVPLVFVGKSKAVEDEAGTLIKSMDEIEVKALPQDLPSEIEVDISTLETFSDYIYVKDLDLPKEVEVDKEKETIIASVQPPEDVEEELERLEEESIEEKVEEIETEEEEEEGEEVAEEKEEDLSAGKQGAEGGKEDQKKKE